MLDVEAGDRLVEEEEARLAVEHRFPDLAEDAGELHALLLAAGKFLIVTAGEACQIDGRKSAVGQRFEIAVGNAGATAHEAEPDDFADGEGEGQARCLREDGTQAGGLPRLQRMEVAAIDPDLAH